MDKLRWNDQPLYSLNFDFLNKASNLLSQQDFRETDP